MCAASVVWGVVCNAPEECSTSLPCCSGVKRSFAPGQFRHVAEYTATPCMERTGEREQYQYRYVDIPIYPYRYK